MFPYYMLSLNVIYVFIMFYFCMLLFHVTNMDEEKKVQAEKSKNQYDSVEISIRNWSLSATL